MRTIVIYHGGNCFDGFCAAWVLSKVCPDAEFVPANYGDSPPDVTGANVIVADFSYKRLVMLDLIRQTRGNLVVLDHHKTAEAELKGIEAECYRDTLDRLPTVVFDMNKSGGRLAWEWVNVTGSAPWLVDYTEDRDLWRWALPHSREINAALRSYPMSFDCWDGLACRRAADLVTEGEAILRCERQTVDSHVRNATEIDIGGHRVLAVNATTLTSEIAGALAADRPFGACWFDRGDGRRVWSLRSRAGGVDVSEVATRFGGGGHRGAAGFQTVTSWRLPGLATAATPAGVAVAVTEGGP